MNVRVLWLRAVSWSCLCCTIALWMTQVGASASYDDDVHGVDQVMETDGWYDDVGHYHKQKKNGVNARKGADGDTTRGHGVPLMWGDELEEFEPEA